MRIQLPPKRFQPIDDPKYDSIRHHNWFRDLEERRKKIPLLEGALNDFRNVGRTQKEAAEAWGVDERELRDYESFVMGKDGGSTPTQKLILDEAYEIYARHGASEPFSHWIRIASARWSQPGRHLLELWETCPRFYPKGYEP